MKKELDIIIPAYNARHTIHRTLASIATQNSPDMFKVTIVNDGGEETYNDLIDFYSNYFEICEINVGYNGGPGVARQYGIDHTELPYITFIDADDTFAGSFVLKELLRQFKATPTTVCLSSVFVEENGYNAESEIKYLPHAKDMVWVFGKMYKREFLNQKNIRFNSTRANEDNGFNTMIRLCCDNQHTILYSQEVSYYWHMTENSITRANNCDYSYNASFPGYVENMIYAIDGANKRNPFNGYIKFFTIEVMMNLYEYYLECLGRAEKYKEQNMQACIKYYNECYKFVKDIDQNIINEVYNMVMRNAYAGNRLVGIVPDLTYSQFIEKLSKEEYTPVGAVKPACVDEPSEGE